MKQGGKVMCSLMNDHVFEVIDYKIVLGVGLNDVVYRSLEDIYLEKCSRCGIVFVQTLDAGTRLDDRLTELDDKCCELEKENDDLRDEIKSLEYQLNQNN